MNKVFLFFSLIILFVLYSCSRQEDDLTSGTGLDIFSPENNVVQPVKVIFTYYDSNNKINEWNQDVYLLGDFNNWSIDEKNRLKGPVGLSRKFIVTNYLKPGRYQYWYYIKNKYDSWSSFKLLNSGQRTINVHADDQLAREDYYLNAYKIIFYYYDIENKVQGDLYLKGDFNNWGDANKMKGPFGSQRYYYTYVIIQPDISYKYKYFNSGSASPWDSLNTTDRYAVISEGQNDKKDYFIGPLTVTFNYYDHESKIITSVLLTGDFNSWNVSSSEYQLIQDPVTNYKYSITLEITTGTYGYKYYADNDWDKLNPNSRTVTVSSTNTRIINDYYAP